MSIPQYKRDIMRIKDLIEIASTSENQVSGFLSNYICIVTSGLIEVAVRGRLSDFTDIRSEGRISSYVQRRLEDFVNPKWEKIENLLKAFDSSWPEEIEARIGEEGIEAINSVVNNRNNFAHGRTGSLSLGVMQGYFRHIEKFISALEEVVVVERV